MTTNEMAETMAQRMAREHAEAALWRAVEKPHGSATSIVLQIFLDRMVAKQLTWFVILDCGHWYRWTGQIASGVGCNVACLKCSPVREIFPSAL